MPRYILKPQEIHAMQSLHIQGVSKTFLSKFTSYQYETHRTTIYRHLNSDPSLYQEKNPAIRAKQWREGKKDQDEARMLAWELREDGYNTLQISKMLKVPLKRVNQYF